MTRQELIEAIVEEVSKRSMAQIRKERWGGYKGWMNAREKHSETSSGNHRVGASMRRQDDFLAAKSISNKPALQRIAVPFYLDNPTDFGRAVARKTTKAEYKKASSDSRYGHRKMIQALKGFDTREVN